MSMRTLTVLLAAVALLLSVSYAARTYLARKQCDERGLVYEAGRGCVPPAGVILQRELHRS